jgi:hypothetical protein
VRRLATPVSKFPRRDDGREFGLRGGGGGKLAGLLVLRTADGCRGCGNWLVASGCGDEGRYALVGVLLCEECRLDSAGDKLEMGSVRAVVSLGFGEYGGGGEATGASGSETVSESSGFCRKCDESPATYQLLVLFVLAMHGLSRRYVGQHHFDVPIPEGCRGHYILRSERTSVICLLLHWPALSRGTRNEPVRRDSRG